MFGAILYPRRALLFNAVRTAASSKSTAVDSQAQKTEQSGNLQEAAAAEKAFGRQQETPQQPNSPASLDTERQKTKLKKD
jgi:hypothetical protein